MLVDLTSLIFRLAGTASLFILIAAIRNAIVGWRWRRRGIG
jgi:hypothetical protein